MVDPVEPIDPIVESLGAYALDAIDDDERRQVDEYLARNPRAQAEVAAHREVAAMLSFGGERAPDRVWDRIAASLEDIAPSPGPDLARVLASTRRHRRRRAAIATGAVAAAAAVAGAAITVVIVDDDDASPSPMADVVQWASGEAWADPAARRTQLVSNDQIFTADAVIDPSGTGFVSAKGLPELPSEQTYQLWGVFADDDVISLGVIGNRPGIEPFTARGDIQALVITLERAGGVVSSTSGALLAGQLA